MRVLPHSKEAEQEVLGACLISKDAVLVATDALSPEDFYLKRHEIIFKAILELNQANSAIDLITVTENLGDLLSKIGGASYIAELSDTLSFNVEAHCQIIKQKSVLRRMIVAASDILEKAYSGEFDEFESFVSDAQAKIMDISNIYIKDFPERIGTVIDRQMETISHRKFGEIEGLTTGIFQLDYWTTGWKPGDLIIIAARPSMGKSSYAIQNAYEIAKQGKTVVVFSIEMAKAVIAEKLLSAVGEFDGQEMRIGAIDAKGFAKMANIVAGFQSINLFVDDTASITLSGIRSKCRRLKAEVGLDFIVVDYLQLISEKAESRVQEISAISRGLKILAKEFSVPVMALSQLNRAVEQTADKRPNLSHLRDSGAIEQDADTVIFITRPEYYNPEDQPGIAELILAKQRVGPIGNVDVAWQKKFTRFKDLSRREEP